MKTETALPCIPVRSLPLTHSAAYHEMFTRHDPAGEERRLGERLEQKLDNDYLLCDAAGRTTILKINSRNTRAQLSRCANVRQQHSGPSRIERLRRW